jgi:hypothetical protein
MPPAKLPAATTQIGPSREFRRHHEVAEPEISLAAFMPAWRVKSRLDRLLRDKAISPAAWSAAIIYRDVYERAHAGHRCSRIAVRNPRAVRRSAALRRSSRPFWRCRMSRCRSARSSFVIGTSGALVPVRNALRAWLLLAS